MDYTLYAIIDPSQLHGDAEVVEVTRAVLGGGACIIQLRDKVSTSRQLYGRACELAEICRQFDVPFIVNNRLDIAFACGADGVHLGPEDLPVEAARRVAGPGFIIGGSAGTVERAVELEKAGATYLGVGALFEARQSKPDASPPRGVKIIADVAQAVEIPIVGIGGINLKNARQVTEQGASGVAVISALMQADDPEAAAQKFLYAMRSPASSKK